MYVYIYSQTYIDFYIWFKELYYVTHQLIDIQIRVVRDRACMDSIIVLQILYSCFQDFILDRFCWQCVKFPDVSDCTHCVKINENKSETSNLIYPTNRSVGILAIPHLYTADKFCFYSVRPHLILGIFMQTTHTCMSLLTFWKW